jgi:hypothetical protein
MTIVSDELLVRAGLDDAPVMHHDDPVGPLDRRQPMGDDQRCASFHQSCQRPLHSPLGLGIQRRGCFVEDQHRGVFQQCPGNRNPLALPAGQQHAPLAALRIEAVGQFVGEFGDIGGLGNALYLLTRIRDQPP